MFREDRFESLNNLQINGATRGLFGYQKENACLCQPQGFSSHIQCAMPSQGY